VLLRWKKTGAEGARGLWERLSLQSRDSRGELRTMPWESLMSNAAAHLASASSSIEELAAQCGRTGGPMVSMELASQSVWTAMVSLEECSLDLWMTHEPAVLVRRRTSRRVNAE